MHSMTPQGTGCGQWEARVSWLSVRWITGSLGTRTTPLKLLPDVPNIGPRTGLATPTSVENRCAASPATRTEQRRDWKGREARLRGLPVQTGGASRSPGKPDPAHDGDGGGRAIDMHGMALKA
jgi:hypothetical protein